MVVSRKQQLVLAFFLGSQFYAAGWMTFQDWLGLERYLEYAVGNWIEYPPFVGIVFGLIVARAFWILLSGSK